MAGGAELIVAWLSEGLAARGHRVTVVSTCGPEMQPYPVETVNGVTVIRFFPRNVYWNFARDGQPSYRRALMASARRLEPRRRPSVPRRHRRCDARYRAHASDRWLLRGDLAPRAPRRHSDRPYRARLPPALSTRLHADPRLEDLPQPQRGVPPLSIMASCHRARCRSVRQSVALSAGTASRGRPASDPHGGRAQRHSAAERFGKPTSAGRRSCC